ncbi:DUF5060 domain-containing protein [candidate division KSB1 bacterium]|nr:DUF5060 domain-containing protein [candidate division KSB1 bacterium]
MNSKHFAHSILVFSLLLMTSTRARIEIERVNSTSVGLYEKFEAIYNLDDFSYNNPYDPDDIDVTAVFTSPSGAQWQLFGFYDDYKNANEWKVRFSPNEIGEWTCLISAKTADRSDQSDEFTFTAVASEHHGWIKLSEENPRYMQYDDGTSYFGVGMYTPWGNSINTFDTLKRFGGNTFAIWNITYGGMVNNFGLIEEQLGRYNQTKCGKIDELIAVAEERDMTIMYCFWPHDLFSNTVWAHQWHLNPYRTVCDVVDVYKDETCWDYQKKQYRYLIARFSYSRAWGIWEIMNEINGTDGWAAGRHNEAKNWVKKVHDYFKANDPYQHLTTASRSGGYGEYWPEMYELIDLPNLHVYETQGWSERYPGNTLRSSMVNYAFAAARFWNNFDQPGIFGEAGADWVRVDVRSPEYEALYHNAIWATLTNGIASTPYWWTFTNPIRDQERAQMFHLAKFVADINFLRESKVHFEITTNDFDLYGMHGDSTVFGWMRQVNGRDVSDSAFDLENVLNPDIPVYAVSYYNTWTGQPLATHIRPHVDGRLRDRTPELATSYPDVAFKITPAQGGDIPARIELSSDADEMLNIDTLTTVLTCYLFDDQDRFCPEAKTLIEFTLFGPGHFAGSAQVPAENGAATMIYHPSDQAGLATIIASSSGLTPDTLTIRIKDKIILDDFESYSSNEDLQTSWLTKSGKADLSLDAQHGDGQSMRLDYGIGAEFKYTAVFEKTITQSFQGGNYFSFWIEPDGSNRDVEIRIYNQDRKYWRYTFPLTGTLAERMVIPLTDFEAQDHTIPFDLSILTFIRFTIRTGQGEHGTGTLYFDDFKFPVTAPSDVKDSKDNRQPKSFELGQNYPNPFNGCTRISYMLPERTHVTLSVYNLQGQLVEQLMNKEQESGTYLVYWDVPLAAASGLYFYQLTTGEITATKKCLLTR